MLSLLSNSLSFSAQHPIAGCDARPKIYAGAVLFGAGSGCFQAVDMAIAVDCLPSKEHSGGT